MCEKQEKDYSLLRPFDLEAVLNGESICYSYSETKVYYITGPDAAGHIAYETQKNRLYTGHIDDFRMVPLCWVEGRPVYRGDGPLYDKYDGVKVFAEGECNNGAQVRYGGACIGTDLLTWTPPKVKREGWVNVYKSIKSAVIHLTKQEADMYATNYHGKIDPDRVACIRIEWEE